MLLENTETEKQYNLLYKQIENLINDEEPLITNLSNFVASIKQTFDKVSWVGFYFLKGQYLYLGPFQGKVACTKIDIGKGVCGTAAETKLSQVVPNVHDFPGHIVCDVESNSEIVIPIFKSNKVIGVLDLDSTKLSAFSDIDRIWLEMICTLITNKLNFSENI